MRIHQALLVVALMLSVVGCDTSPVADDLGQREANQIVSILREHGIEGATEKGRGSRGRYTVKVSASQFGEAASLLSKLGLPAERRASFAELVAPSGLLPASQNVEDLRLDRAMASEVEDLLEGYSGVSSANVVVRSHSIAGGDQASVSVVVQKEHGAAISESNLRQMVERAVPGVRGENVLLAVAEAPAMQGGGGASKGAADLVPFLMFWRVPENEYVGLAMLLGGLLIVVSALAGVGGYIYGQFSVARAVDGGSSPSVDTGNRERRDDDESTSEGGA
jgi:type III secretory pathway lipoprotein EscJ